jgi:aspartate carbamoyltransferase catalytic subunit
MDELNNVKFNDRDFISVKQYTKEKLEQILELAKTIKANPLDYSNKLKGKIVATLFFEPSTRTRLSFESAILRLGGSLISTENARENSSGIKGEGVEDTIRVMDGYADCIIMRHFKNDAAITASKFSRVPVINAGSGSWEHPTQALLDVFTIKEKLGRLDNLKILVSGDLKYGRTAPSLLKIFTMYENVEVYGLTTKSFTLQQEVVDILNAHGIKYQEFENIEDVPKDVDVWYQTRVQKERMEISDEDCAGHNKVVAQKPFSITLDMLNKFPNAFLLHPLPIDDEVEFEVDSSPRAVYFEQAHNGVWTRMALLVDLMCK